MSIIQDFFDSHPIKESFFDNYEFKKAMFHIMKAARDKLESEDLSNVVIDVLNKNQSWSTKFKNLINETKVNYFPLEVLGNPKTLLEIYKCFEDFSTISKINKQNQLKVRQTLLQKASNIIEYEGLPKVKENEESILSKSFSMLIAKKEFQEILFGINPDINFNCGSKIPLINSAIKHYSIHYDNEENNELFLLCSILDKSNLSIFSEKNFGYYFKLLDLLYFEHIKNNQPCLDYVNCLLEIGKEFNFIWLDNAQLQRIAPHTYYDVNLNEAVKEYAQSFLEKLQLQNSTKTDVSNQDMTFKEYMQKFLENINTPTSNQPLPLTKKSIRNKI